MSSVAKRPLPLTILSSFLMFNAVSGAVSFYFMTQDPLQQESLKQLTEKLPLSTMYIMSFGQALFALISGIGILMGKNWARRFYFVTAAANLVLFLLVSNIASMILFLLFTLVFSFFLTRPEANNFFKS